jgi:prepilin-type N-terminal cleavage/methylation domain-containing protein
MFCCVFWEFFGKKFHVKMGKTGGWAVCNEELKAENKECLFSRLFSDKLLPLFRSSPFGFTLVELLVVIGLSAC